MEVASLSYLTTSTAPALTLGSRPVTETDAVKDPSMLKTTHSVFGGTMVRYSVELVWSPLQKISLSKVQ